MMKKIFVCILFLFLSSSALAKDGADSLISPGELASAHAKFEGITNCTKCHRLGGGLPDGKCLDCHEKLDKQIKNKQGLHAKFKESCVSCHPDHKGRKFKMISVEKDKFNHDRTDYPLKDKHADVKCNKCHKTEGVWTGLKQSCNFCHDDKHKKQLSQECDRCHNFKGWKDIDKFKHNVDSVYSLTGKHIEVKCEKCHVSGRFKPIENKKCDDCHKDEHKKQFAARRCDACHTTKAWKTTSFDHNAPEYKGYRLEGKHLKVACAKCHADGKFKPVEHAKCLDCHKDAHKKQFVGKTCESCHNTNGWKTLAFDHNSQEYNGYKLDGKHLKTPCEKCHVNGRFKPIEYKKCDDCHKDEHKKQFVGKTCESCHSTKGWKTTSFDHGSPEYKGYKLEGKHIKTPCDKCHVNGRFKPVEYKKCDNCHKDEHKKQFTEKPCDLCHTPNSWKTTFFEHNSPTYRGYKLEGKHIKTPCDKCHIDGKYRPIDTVCQNCHKKDDTHKGELGLVCSKCHTPFDWKKSTLNHNLQTKFPLIGKHTDTDCAKCHKNKVYKTKAEKCLDCHKDTHKGEFKEECSSCHTQSNWEPRKFDHKKRTGTELYGVHLDAVCSNCHLTKADYKQVNRYCNQCHVDPHFNQFGMVECSKCHSQHSWTPTQFKHNATGFPLLGRHRAADCQDCHKERFYRNVSQTCYTCHEKEYLSAPGHIANGFGTDCVSCHVVTFTTWAFRHPSQKSCASCHLNARPVSHTSNPATYPTTCELCHVSTTTWTAHRHPSASSGCSSCHLSYSTPTRPADHTTNNWTVCETCHRYPTWTFIHISISSGCSSCHLLYSTPARPASHTTYNWTVCETCHKSTSSWLPVTHPTATSGCSSCHLTYSTPTRPASHTTYNWTVCETCHKSTSSWLPVTHPTATSGCSSCHLTYSTPTRPASHTTYNWTVCETCHKSTSSWLPVTHPTATSGCSSCHLTYSTPTRPASHTTYNWTVCENCHKSTSSWLPVTHPSSSTTGCNSCHLTYSTPTRPADHTTNSWTVCETCHKSTSTWTFTHPTTTFPRTHQGTSPTDCAACHPSGAYTNKGGCIECHTSRGISHHNTNSNSGCLGCHPTGRK